MAPPEAKPKVYDLAEINDLCAELRTSLLNDDDSSTSSQEHISHPNGRPSGGLKKGLKGLFSQSAKFSKSVKR